MSRHRPHTTPGAGPLLPAPPPRTPRPLPSTPRPLPGTPRPHTAPPRSRASPAHSRAGPASFRARPGRAPPSGEVRAAFPARRAAAPAALPPRCRGAPSRSLSGTPTRRVGRGEAAGKGEEGDPCLCPGLGARVSLAAPVAGSRLCPVPLWCVGGFRCSSSSTQTQAGQRTHSLNLFHRGAKKLTSLSCV